MVGTPSYPGSLGDKFSAFKNALSETRTAANTRSAMSVVKAATLSFLGDVIVQGGGRLIARYSETVAAMVVGQSLHSTGYKGWWVYRPEGQVVMSVFGDELGNGYFAIYDKNFSILLSEDSVSGWGLASPFLSYNIPTPADPASVTRVWGQTAATTLSTIAHSYVRIYHPRLAVFGITATDAGVTSAEFAIFINGAQASTTFTGSFDSTFNVPNWGTTIKPGDRISVELKARVAAGTGTVYCQLQGMDGLGS